MLPHFDLPLAVQADGVMTVLSTEAQFIEAMAGHLAALIASGVTSLVVRMTAMELPRKGRFRIWADFDHVRAGGTDPGADQVILYCRRDAAGFRVELLHCTRLALTVSAVPRSAMLA